MGIKAIADSYFQRYSHKQIDSLAGLLADQAIYEDPLKEYVGKQEVLDGLKSYFGNIGHLDYRVARSFVSGKFVMYQGMVAFQFSEAEFGAGEGMFDYLTAFGVSLKLEQGLVVRHVDYIDMEAFDRQRESQLNKGVHKGVTTRLSLEEEVRQTLNDYMDGIYKNEPRLIERSVRADLFKRGFTWSDEGYYCEESMSYQGLLAFVTSFRDHPENPRKDITVFEVNDQTASSKVETWWGVDYMLLARKDGKWQVVEVLWQDRKDNKSS